MSWADNIRDWRRNVKAGAPAAPSTVGSPAGQSSSLYARSRSAPPPSDAMTSISRRPPNPRAAPDPLPQYGGGGGGPAYQPRQPISRAWDRRQPLMSVGSPSPSRSRSRSSGTPPAPAPGARRYAPQPVYGPPRPAVPLVPVLPVSPPPPPPAVVHIPYAPAQQHVILVQSPPPYYAGQPLSSTAMATAGSPPDLGASPCPSCHRSIPTLELRSHLARSHGWRV